LTNSLGIFEHTQVFHLLHQVLTTIGLVSIGHEKALEAIEESRIKSETVLKHLIESGYEERVDLTGGKDKTYFRLVNVLLHEVKKVVAVLELIPQCISIQK
jgi:hypothetical protein